MAKFPEPPPAAQLAGVQPDWRELPEGARLWRIYFRAGPHPTSWKDLRHFGPTQSRFDHHPAPPRAHPAHGILYAALDAKSPIGEVFQAARVVDRSHRSPWLVAFELTAPLRLFDLTGTWPTRAGASMAISSGRRDRARRWARAIYAAFPGAQGIYYPSSMYANEPSIAMFERGRSSLPHRPLFHRALSDAALFWPLSNAAGDLGYRLV